MFESLQNGLSSAFKTLRGQGKLTEGNMRDGLKLVEKALLEADVSYEVVRSFMKRVSEEALGEKVLKALRPSEQVSRSTTASWRFTATRWATSTACSTTWGRNSSVTPTPTAGSRPWCRTIATAA